VPSGLFEPDMCRNIKCMATIIIIINGKIKWIIKNRLRVGLLTANPPHSHSTSCLPIYGIAEKIFVITVAPQNLICPQGSTYPIKAVAMVTIKIVTPIFQVSFM